jgi:hypothetical protein
MLTEEIAFRSSRADLENEKQVGRYCVENYLLGIVGLDSKILVTPNTPSKLEILKKQNTPMPLIGLLSSLH